jgi:alpha-tubulin suppressor-like RCC1 family protein/uncharacterized protein YjdB
MLFRYSVKATLVLTLLLVLWWAGACSDGAGPDPSTPLSQGVVVSDPVEAAPASLSAARTSAATAGTTDLVYASLLPGTVPQGLNASVRSIETGSLVWKTVQDGGFDHLGVTAAVGDTIEIQVLDASEVVVYDARVAVAALRAPIVARIYPPRRKRDVPLNSAIVIVFSEPVAQATLSSSVRVYRGSLSVPGSVHLLQGTGAEAAFVPAQPLAPSSDYRLVVTAGVRDLDGDALEAEVTSPFTTGQASLGAPASMTLSPDTVYMTGPTYQLTATVRDASDNPLIDQPVVWASGDSSIVTMSPTGLVTGLAQGISFVSATVNGLSASTEVIVLPPPPGPPASITILPSSPSFAAGDTIVLTATVLDAAGNPTSDQPVTWTSSDLAVATVGDGTVIGVSPGNVKISATAGSVGDTAFATVLPRRAVASVGVGPAAASVAVEASKQLRVWLRDADGKEVWNRPVSWTSDNAAVATVDPNGVVTGVALGSAAVIATSEGVSDTAAITVTNEPVALTFVSVSAGFLHTCGVTVAGDAYCWGDNAAGALGVGATTGPELCTPGTIPRPCSTAPVLVTGGLSFSSVSAGFSSTCGVTTSGVAYCWGINDDGELGDGTRTPRSSPVLVVGGLKFASVSTTFEHTCGVTEAGAAYCWGSAQYGALGDGSSPTTATPVQVAGGLHFTEAEAGGAHTCGLTDVGTIHCWGSNSGGELGDGTTTDRPTPLVVVGWTFAAVSVGRSNTCGLLASGDAYCWGFNARGQLGDGTTSNRSSPTPVAGGLSFAALSAGGNQTCGLTAAGALYCWGLNILTPTPVTGGVTFATVSASDNHVCGLTAAGAAYCWGWNIFGGLGDGTIVDRQTPTPVVKP